MTQWYVKELSQLTKVSVKTLHHYDKIGLLKPSVRLSNGYRLYSEADLLKVQQILALKFFGFELGRIKTLMQEEINIFDHFRAQQQFLEQQVKSLQKASQTLGAILSETSPSKSVSWKTILKLIEDYRMTKELKNDWVAKCLNPSELKEYASFEQGLKARFTEAEKEARTKIWNDLVKEIEANLDKDPASDLGIDIGKRSMDWVNELYGKEHAALRTTIWEKGFQGGHTGLDPEVVDWLDKAIEAYHKKRIRSILDQVENLPSDAVLKLWKDALTDMYGDAQAPKNALYELILVSDEVSLSIKNWMKKHV